jgi:very-short-patch-repair endonuclease
MLSSVASARRDAVSASIEQLRLELLDLKRSNPLISFDHESTAASRSHVRAVDRGLDDIYLRLIEPGKPIPIYSLPPMPTVLPEAATPAFRPALEIATQTDQALPEPPDLSSPDEAIASKTRKNERTNGNKLRKTGANPSIVEHAQRHGIDPSFDLRETAGSAPERERKSSFSIQTLLDPEGLDKALSKLRDRARLMAEETSVSPLYAAFGFLEWYEAETSDRALTSPILLLKTELGRIIEKARFQYLIEEAGEDVQINLTLSERLKRDFKITLPDIDEEELPSAYLARVESDVCKGRPRWRVRRFMTLALFPFALISMFNDLGEEQWADAGGLADNPVLGDLLGGSDSIGALFAVEHDIDSEAVAEAVPVLVVEADGSQHSAIYDAMTKKNLVIQGPPGTGKSQTITNLIASALAKGQRVLFVAAKQAALQVVKDRLETVGLGHFCFDIHSETARKKDVVGALDKRLLLRGQRPIYGLETRKSELVRLKAQLTRYAEILNTPFGAERRTIHQIMWADRRRRQMETEEARRLDGIVLQGAEHMPDVEVTKLKALAIRYERAAGPVLAVAAGPDRHPWHGVRRSSLPATDVELAQREMNDLAHGLEQLNACAMPFLTALGLPLEAGLADILDASRLLSPLRIPPQFSEHWYFALQSDDRRRDATEWLRLVGLFRETISALQKLGAVSDPLPSASAIDALLSAHSQLRPAVGDALTMARMPVQAERLRGEAETAERLLSAARECLEAFGLSATLTVDALATMARLATAVAGAEERVLASISPALFARQAPEELAAASERLTKLWARHRALEEDYDLAKARSPDDLLKCAEILRSAGPLAFLSGTVKEAQQTFVTMCRADKKRSKAQMADALTRIADYLLDVEKLEDDDGLRRLFGKCWRAMRTDEPVAGACAALGQLLRSKLVGYDDVTAELRRIVAEAEEDRFRAVAALRDRVLTPSLVESLGSFAAGTVLNAELPASIRARAGMLDDYAAACVALGFPADAPLSQHVEIMRTMSAAVEAEVAVERAMGWTEPMGFGLPDPRHGDTSPLENAIKAAEAIERLDAPPSIRTRLGALSSAAVMDTVAGARSLESHAAEVIALWAAVRERLEVDETLYFGAPFLNTALPHLVERCHHSVAQRDTLGAWVAYLLERQEAASRGLGDLVQAWDEGAVRGSLADAVERVFQRSLAREAYARYPELNRYTGFGLEQVRHQFRELDEELNRLDRQDLVAKLLKTPIPEGNGVGKRSDFTDLALIRHEVSKKTKHIPIRRLLDRAGKAIQAMKPCFMMSPLSVAQYIRPGALRFDLLVIDEASQMRPEEAVGVIARCDQMVVVGDPEQLPPTDFFDKGDALSDDDESDERIDAESILDQALARFSPARRLRWHYRSQHDSLIAFSNKEFYEGDLIVFPSPGPAGDGQGVSLEKIDGLYRGRRNVPEATAVCRAAVEHMLRRPDRSLGIVTLNIVQKDLIQEEMDRLSSTNGAVEAYQSRWRQNNRERFFVKNLENVQGDERDTIFVSTVFGPSEPGGPVRQNFGPINKPGGHRRLNVLFTRAKHELRLFTSMTPDQIGAGPQTPRGARVLRNYLTFAATGRLEAGEETGREPDSDFEMFVADRLRAAGYDCAYQVGVSGFLLDIAVRDPSQPDVFICGVECDGANYHSTKSARDRDILRQKILEGFGWNIYRIWSTDWFRDPNGQTAKLVEHLASLT